MYRRARQDTVHWIAGFNRVTKHSTLKQLITELTSQNQKKLSKITCLTVTIIQNCIYIHYTHTHIHTHTHTHTCFIKYLWKDQVIVVEVRSWWGIWYIWSENYLTLYIYMYSKEIQPVDPKGDQSWVFGRNDAKAETPVLWPPHAKSWLIGKDSDAGRDWGQEEKGTTEDEMAGGHHWFDACESEWTPGVGDGQGGLAGCNSWGCRVRHDWATELNWKKIL